MAYTKEEKEKIRNNVKQIEEYCKREISPFADKHGILADLSEIKYRKSDGSPYKKSFYLRVYGDGTVVFTQSAAQYVLEENPAPDEWRYNIYEDVFTMEDLLIRWQRAKSKLHEEIRKQGRKKSDVLNFQV